MVRTSAGETHPLTPPATERCGSIEPKKHSIDCPACFALTRLAFANIKQVGICGFRAVQDQL
jgi:hypothetical protein